MSCQKKGHLPGQEQPLGSSSHTELFSLELLASLTRQSMGCCEECTNPCFCRVARQLVDVAGTFVSSEMVWVQSGGSYQQVVV